jgi:cbb3-type cytochrome oxidase maturation protein
MDSLLLLVPVALGLGTLGLAAFFWALRNGQYEDLKGASERILIDDENRNAP